MKDAREGRGGGGSSSRVRSGGGASSGKNRLEDPHEDDDEANNEMTDTAAPEGWEPLPGDAGDGIPWRLPTLEEVNEELMERRRRKLLETLG